MGTLKREFMRIIKTERQDFLISPTAQETNGTFPCPFQLGKGRGTVGRAFRPHTWVVVIFLGSIF